MTTAEYLGHLTGEDHGVQLRRAVIAATVGTTIEWYDFFIYGTAASTRRSATNRVGLWVRLGILETPVFRRASGRGDPPPAEGNHPVGAAAHGRAGAILHPHRLRLRLCHRHAENES